jgi:hypothetical protein
LLFGGVLQTTPGECVPSGIDNAAGAASIMLMPNPARNEVVLTTASLADAHRMVGIRNLLGQVVLSASMPTQRLALDIASLPSGIFMVEITTDSRRDSVLKLVKE